MDKSGHLFKLSRRRRRLRYLTRRAGAAAVIAAVVALLVVADRAGMFGRREVPDERKYHGRSFRVVRVIDGDTLDVDCADGRHATTRIRLLGVDTPETVKPDTPVEHYGPEATRFVREAAMGKTVTLRLDRLRVRDRYRRLLAYAILPDGENLNLRIVATGHGYADPRFRHPLQGDFRRAQRQAMKEGEGLWRDATDADLPFYYKGRLKLPTATSASRPAVR